MKKTVIKYTCDSCGLSSIDAQDYLEINTQTMYIFDVMGLGKYLEHICIECRLNGKFRVLEMSKEGDLIIPDIKAILKKLIFGETL